MRISALATGCVVVGAKRLVPLSGWAHQSDSPADPPPQLTFRVEPGDVAELLLTRGHQGFRGDGLQLRKVLLERGAEQSATRLMVCVRAAHRLFNDLVH